MPGHLLGLVHVKFEGSPTDAIPLAVILGLVFMSAGMWALSKSFDLRPVIVVDSEGLFYRPHGESLIPWRDICAVERDTSNGRIVLIRHSAPRMNMSMHFLPEGEIYKAIMQAWKSHGAA